MANQVLPQLQLYSPLQDFHMQALPFHLHSQANGSQPFVGPLTPESGHHSALFRFRRDEQGNEEQAQGAGVGRLRGAEYATFNSLPAAYYRQDDIEHDHEAPLFNQMPAQTRRYNQHKSKRPVYVSIKQQTVNGLLSLLLLFIISICGCMGTIFIISALTVIESLQTRGNCYLVSLALAHLLVTLLVIPSSALQIMAGEGINAQLLCHYQWLTLEFSLIVSQLSFMLIAADNYLGYKSSEKVTTTSQRLWEGKSLHPLRISHPFELESPARSLISNNKQLDNFDTLSAAPMAPRANERALVPISEHPKLVARRPTSSKMAALLVCLGSPSNWGTLGSFKNENSEQQNSALGGQFSGQMETKLAGASCVSYRRCCSHLKVLVWILLVWLVALAYIVHQHELSYGNKFCATQTKQATLGKQHSPANDSSRPGGGALNSQMSFQQFQPTKTIHNQRNNNQLVSRDEAGSRRVVRLVEKRATRVDDALAVEGLVKSGRLDGDSLHPSSGISKIGTDEGANKRVAEVAVGGGRSLLVDSSGPLSELATTMAKAGPQGDTTRGLSDVTGGSLSSQEENDGSGSGGGTGVEGKSRVGWNRVFSLARTKAPGRGGFEGMPAAVLHKWPRGRPTDRRRPPKGSKTKRARAVRATGGQLSALDSDDGLRAGLVGGPWRLTGGLRDREANTTKKGELNGAKRPEGGQSNGRGPGKGWMRSGRMNLSAIRLACGSCHRNRPVERGPPSDEQELPVVKGAGENDNDCELGLGSELDKSGRSSLGLGGADSPKEVGFEPERGVGPSGASDMVAFMQTHVAADKQQSSADRMPGSLSASYTGESLFESRDEVAGGTRVGQAAAGGDSFEPDRAGKGRQVWVAGLRSAGRYAAAELGLDLGGVRAGLMNNNRTANYEMQITTRHPVAGRRGPSWGPQAKSAQQAERIGRSLASQINNNAPLDSSAIESPGEEIATNSPIQANKVHQIPQANLGPTNGGQQNESSASSNGGQASSNKPTVNQLMINNSSLVNKNYNGRQQARPEVEQLYWTMLVGTIIIPTLVSTILFASAYLRMKEFKMRPYKPMPLSALNASLPAGLLLGQPPCLAPLVRAGESGCAFPAELEGANKAGGQMDRAKVLVEWPDCEANSYSEQSKRSASQPSGGGGGGGGGGRVAIVSHSPSNSANGKTHEPRRAADQEEDMNLVADRQQQQQQQPAAAAAAGLSQARAQLHQPLSQVLSAPTYLSQQQQLRRPNQRGPSLGSSRPEAPFTFVQPPLVGGNLCLDESHPLDVFQDTSFSAPPSATLRQEYLTGARDLALKTQQQQQPFQQPNCRTGGQTFAGSGDQACQLQSRRMEPFRQQYDFRRRQHHAQSFHYGCSASQHALEARPVSSAPVDSLECQPAPRYSFLLPETGGGGGGSGGGGGGKTRPASENLRPQSQSQSQQQPQPQPQLQHVQLEQPMLGRQRSLPRSSRLHCSEPGRTHVSAAADATGQPPVFGPASEQVESRNWTHEASRQLYQDRRTQMRASRPRSGQTEPPDQLEERERRSGAEKPALQMQEEGAAVAAALANVIKSMDEEEEEEESSRSPSVSANQWACEQHSGRTDLQTKAPQSIHQMEAIDQVGGKHEQQLQWRRLQEFGQPVCRPSATSEAPTGVQAPSAQLGQTLAPGSGNKVTLCTYSYMTDDQLLKSNIIVFVLNLTLWLPFILLSVVARYREHLSQELRDSVWWMATLNCCSCSYAYALTNKDFREAFNKLFYYCCCKSHVTFQRKTPIFRRQLDVDSRGNLRVHIIPGLNLYSTKANGVPLAASSHAVNGGGGGGGNLAHSGGHQHASSHHPVLSGLSPDQSGHQAASPAGGQRHHYMSVGGGFGGPLFASTKALGHHLAGGAKSPAGGLGRRNERPTRHRHHHPELSGNI